MVYGSVCSGIEAATVAWEPLGWKAAWFSEIEPFPNAVLAHRFPNIPNLGDMTEIHDTKTFQESKIDLLVGGTPCQSFSLAGKRGGLDDPRGNLALEFLRIAGAARPRWLVWENVPGVLSSGDGRDFGAFLRAIQELGYWWAYRVLDARYFGVPQRRRRVFVVGHRSDWRRAARVLFEPESLQGDSAPDAAKGQERPAVGGGPGEGNRQAVGADVYNHAITGDIAATFGANSGGTNTAGAKLIDERGIRRLTPIECERLMGFPDDYTRIPWKGRSAERCPDSKRYKAVGNSMAVPVMRWIGQRIGLARETLPREDGGGENGTLIVPGDSPGGGISSQTVEDLIQEIWG